MCDGIDVIV